MANTEVQRKSENKGIITGIDREFFRLYCEENEELQKSVEDLINLRNTTQDERIRVDINKYIISQLIGNPKQATEIEAGTGIEIIVKSGIIDDSKTEDTD